MKTLYINYKSVVSTLVVLLIGLSAHLTGFAEVTPISERTQQVKNAIVAALPSVTNASDVTDTHLASITNLNLRNKDITALKSGDFSGLTGLTNLNLYGNMLGSLPDGIFEGLTALTTLRLGGNTTNPMLLTVSLEKVGDNQFKAVSPTGAPFNIVLPIGITNGSSSATTITIAKGSTESDLITPTRNAGTTAAVTANIGTLPSLPTNHYGYTLTKPETLPIEIIGGVPAPVTAPEISVIEGTPPSPPAIDETPANTAPTFTDDDTVIRSVAENTAAGIQIGTAVSATDVNDDTLTYTLTGTDATSFEIDSETGQLKTKAELDYETKRVYVVNVTASDGSLTDTITVIVRVIDRADTPLVSMLVPVSDRTPAVRNAIVAAVTGVTAAADVTATHLAAITSLDLRSDRITSLKTGDFSGLTGLTSLNLYGNMFTRLPVGIFEGLTALRTLRLGGNLVDPMPLIVSLQQVDANQFQAIIPTGAPFDIVLPIGTMMITIPKGSIKSAPFTAAASVEIGALPGLPPNHFGYILAKSTTCNRTLQVTDVIAAAVPGITDCRNITEIDLAIITSLNLNNKGITSLSNGDFAGMLSLTTLNLSNNQLSNLPDRIFAGLTSLTTLNLRGNTVEPLPLLISLQKVGTNRVKILVSTGAPFDLVLPVTVENGSLGRGTNITISKGSVESKLLLVTRTANTTGAVTVDIGTMPSLPATHNGYVLVKPDGLPLEIFRRINIAPMFTAGATTTRSIAENTASGVNIGTTVSATDADSDTLTYSLGGTDAVSFAIDTESGQLKTSAALDYETKSSYSVTITVSDGRLTDIISITIKVTDVDEKPVPDDTITTGDENVTTPMNNAPVFTDGDSTTRNVAENTGVGVNIGSAVSATDTDGHTLTYSLDGTDAASFSMDSSSGQLRASTTLDYETKSSYFVTITVSDGNLTDSIAVTINVTDVDETPANNTPAFSAGDSTTRTIAENTGSGVNIGSVVSATDADDDTLTYSLGGTDAATFNIDSTSGQLRTSASLDYETKPSYTVTINVSDGNGGSDSITVTINITDVDETPSNNAPTFSDSSTTRTIAENTGSGVNIGSVVSATDADDDTLTYSLDGTDAAAFNIDSTSGRLRTSASLDYETKPSYTVTINVSDGNGGSDSITVTINITDVDETPSNNAPTFSDSSTTRTIAENTGSGVNIGSAVSATDADDDTLTYSLGGTDAATFNIDSTSGQLRTSASLDYETKPSYKVTITVSDGNGGSDSITATINVINVDETPSNNAPVFTAGSSTPLTVAENTAAGKNIGTAVAATDADSNTLTYSLGGTDAATFNIDTAIGQLKTSASLDYETKSAYKITIIASDGSLTDSINVTINVTNVNEAPVFSDGTTTTRAIAENVGADINIGTVVAASDVDSTNLTYTLGGTDAAAFSIDTKTGQLKTKATLDYETKTSYTVIITVSDGSLTDSIMVTIKVTNLDETPSNNAPVLTDGNTTTRSIKENSTSGTNIGAVITATDADNNTLAYLLSGTDASSFAIDSTTGQLKTSAALDHETKASYTVTVTVSDGTTIDRITVTITVTDVNEAPVFADGSSITLSIDENTATGSNIGSTLSATDPDDDTLTYTLGGTDAASFSIVGTTGQLKTKSALDYETKSSYEVTVSVSDRSLTDSIKVTINIMDIDENRAPAFTDGTSATRSVAENTGSGVDIGTAVAATDADDDELTWTLSGIDAAAFSIDSTSGQLRTKAALDYETKTSYTITITVSDRSLTDSIKVTINIMDIDENRAPAFTDGTSATRSVAENTGSGVDIGTAVAATDADDDELTWTLSGIDAAAFSIDSTSGQLRTKAALDHETKTSYTITITVSDSSLMDSIKVTINIMDIDENRAPAFTDGTSATRSVAENTGSGVDIGTAVAATDADDDELTWTLSGIDAAAFNIDSTSGQLRTKSALDYETKSSYEVTVSVSDRSLTDSIKVTINIMDIDENRAPAFTEGTSATRSVAENTGSGVDIGTAVAATDADDDELTWTLSGIDAAAFSIDSTSGQLRTKAALDYETKTSYTITITVSDGSLMDSIKVTINIMDIDENRAPAFTEGTSATRSVAENTGSGVDIGTAVAATDADDDELTWTLSGIDAAAFNIDSTSGQLRTKSALDYETKSSYSVTISVSDGNDGSDSITVTITVTDVTENSAPVFTDGASTTRSIAENTAAGTNIGTPVSATDADNNTLTYTLGGTNSASFAIVSISGQLQTKAALNYERKTSYSVTVTVSDGNNGNDSITVTINITNVVNEGTAQQNINSAPTFTEGIDATRSVAENTAAETNIGTAVAATDADDDELTYTLGGTNAASFSIVSTSGQLKTRSALDYETKSSYSVTISVSDGNGGSDSITVTINVTDVTENKVTITDKDVTENNAPVFTDGASTTRSIAENTAAGTNIGTPVSATDADNNTLTYTLGGTNSASFAIVSTSGQLQTKAALNYERKTSYSVTISVSDGNNGNDSITVTINITNVVNEGTAQQNINSAPTFTEGIDATRSVAENTAAGTNIGTAVAATDANSGDTLTYSLGGADAASFAIVTTSGQLQTKAALDYETKTSYTVTVSVSDGKTNGTDSITVTINVTDVNEGTSAQNTNSAPTFTESTSATRSIAENTAAGTNIGTAVAATDANSGDTLTYSLGGIDAASFAIISTSGQLQTKAALDYETKTSYTITVSVSDGKTNGTDSITVTINVTNVNENYVLYGRTELVQQIIFAAVTLTDTSVTSVEEVTAAHLASITELSMVGDFFEDDVFDDLTALKLGDFSGLTALTSLRISYTNIGELHEDIFDGLTNLESITLTFHKFKTLPEDIFDGLTKLESIDLSANFFESLPEDIFDGLTKLKSINLTHNAGGRLTTLPEDIFDGLSNLETLNFWSNRFTTLSEDIFDGLAKLKYLSLRGNRLPTLPEDIFDGLSKLETLDLTSSIFSSLPEDVFDGLTALKVLNLGPGRLPTLPSDIFDGLSNLVCLTLFSNFLGSLPSDVFAGLSKLEKLDMQTHSIRTLPDGIFAGLTSLKELNVDPDYVGSPYFRFYMTLTKTGTGKFKAKFPIGATYNITIPLIIENGSITGGVNSVTLSTGSTESAELTVTRTAGTTGAVTVTLNLNRLQIPPENHDGYYLFRSNDLPLTVIDAVGGAPTTINNDTVPTPKVTALLANFPNPFNPETWIPYQLARQSSVSITIYDIRGNVVRQLYLGQRRTGFYTDRSRAAHWDGRNKLGERVANGVYFYVLKAGDYAATRKMLILK